MRCTELLQADPHARDESRAMTCPACGRVNVPLNGEPDLTFCLAPDCGQAFGEAADQ